MTDETKALSLFAVNLRYDDIPAIIIDQAKDCIVDTIGAAMFGATLPWSEIVINYARRYGANGKSTIWARTPIAVQAPFAALANGALAHAFEIDNLRQPGAGVHPGATLLPAAFSIGEEVGVTGRDILTAFVAGCEVMSRIGIAARNTSEKLGFHAPGLTGVFGGTIAAGRLLGLDAEGMTRALGIAGSLCSGVLAFAKAGNGGMVKRLHMGRAAEGGVLAARLAADGFAGPDVILEGQFGFFSCFAREPAFDKLVADLGSRWETSRICIKCYPCHVTSHTPVYALMELRRAHGFGGADIADIELAVGEKVLSHHIIRDPGDIATAQYSLPFCAALALFRDPADPASFLGEPYKDFQIQSMTRRIKCSLNENSLKPGKEWAARVTVRLRDGRELTLERDDFKGAPSSPMTKQELEEKFLKLTVPSAESRALFARFQELERIDDVRTIFGGISRPVLN